MCIRDRPYTHWAAGYIKTAVQQGWLTGYLDGSFRPDKTVTLEEAATGVLKLLGYTTEDFSGSYPYGQLALSLIHILYLNIVIARLGIAAPDLLP